MGLLTKGTAIGATAMGLSIGLTMGLGLAAAAHLALAARDKR